MCLFQECNASGNIIPEKGMGYRSFTTIYGYIMTQNLNDDITRETLENQITLETLDHLIINPIKQIRCSEKTRPDENSIFERLNKTLGNPELSKQYIESRL